MAKLIKKNISKTYNLISYITSQQGRILVIQDLYRV